MPYGEPGRDNETRRAIFAWGAVLVVAVFATWSNGFSGPWVFDDASSIVANPTIRHVWPPWSALSPPNASITVQGRPILNFSLALNYAISGNAVWSYHALNVAIHLGAALALFGLVRRTLALRDGRSATPVAGAAALLWAVHPLQTESVTYTIQRAESLMGCFFLLTFYCFVRATAPVMSADRQSLEKKPARVGRVGWYGLAWVACALGAATKEVMVVAPPLLLLYDRTFVSGSFREAWRRHRGIHLALFATWLELAALVFGGGGNRGGSFGTGGALWAYPLTQCEAVARYLGLAVWPHPLVFEYGTFWVKSAADVIPWAMPVAGLVAGTAVALWRWPACGFLGAWFLAILAPTSLLPGTTQMIVEHRMYLSLAAIAVLVAIGLRAWWGARSIVVVAGAAVALACVTRARNADYRSEVALWSDTVAKRPANALAHQLLGMALVNAGETESARTQFEAALRLRPNFALAHDCLGQLLLRAKDRSGAAAEFETALRLQPEFADAHDHLAKVLAAQGKTEGAAEHFAATLRLKPDFPDAERDWADLLVEAGRLTEAIGHYEAVVRLRPDQPAVQYNLGNALAMAGRQAEAIPPFEAAIRLKPDYVEAYNNLGAVLLDLGRRDEAAARFETALRLDPSFSDARENLRRVHALERK